MGACASKPKRSYEAGDDGDPTCPAPPPLLPPQQNAIERPILLTTDSGSASSAGCPSHVSALVASRTSTSALVASTTTGTFDLASLVHEMRDSTSMNSGSVYQGLQQTSSQRHRSSQQHTSISHTLRGLMLGGETSSGPQAQDLDMMVADADSQGYSGSFAFPAAVGQVQ